MDLQLIKRLDGHFLAAMAAAGGGGQTVRLAGALTVVNPRVRSTALNFMTLRETDPDHLTETLRQGAAILAGHGRPPAAYLTPLSGNVPALRKRLGALRWRRHTTVSVLCAPLGCEAASGVNDTPVVQAEAGPRAGESGPPQGDRVRIEQIGPDGLQRWLDVLTEGYEAMPDAAIQVRAAWSTLMAQPGDGATACYYLGYVGERAVGTGLLWQQGMIAGLYCGAVAPAYRRRGIGTALLARRIAAAAQNGAALVTLQTESGSLVERVCTSTLGFQTAYQMELWLSGR